MHFRRLASLLIGAWLAAGIFMDFVAITNFRSVDQFLNAPNALAAEQMRQMGGKPAVRVLLRHEMGELNRALFEQWEIAQFGIGIALILVLVFGQGDAPKAALILTVVLLGIVAVDRFFLTPSITQFGRLLDYPDTPGANPALFWKLHGAYSALELLKLGIGLVIAGTLLIRRTDRKKFVREHEKLTRALTT